MCEFMGVILCMLWHVNCWYLPQSFSFRLHFNSNQQLSKRFYAFVNNCFFSGCFKTMMNAQIVQAVVNKYAKTMKVHLNVCAAVAIL